MTRSFRALLNQSAPFLLPFLFWLWLFRGFFTGKAVVIQDTFTFYASVKFFLSNLTYGVYPLWDPYVLWGESASLELRPIGEFNPFLYLILLLHSAGIDFYHSFLSYLVLYFFVGVLGFYFLAKTVFHEKRLAYTAYLLMMFSSLGMIVFSQINILLLFTPAAWFFYFLLAFYQKKEMPLFVGMVFSLIIIMTTYLPFYFLTVLGLFIILIVIFYPSRLKETFKIFPSVLRKNRASAFICLGAFLVAMIVPVLTYREVMKGDMVVSGRYMRESPDGSTQKDKTIKRSMNYQEASAGGLTTRMWISDLFSNLGNVQYENDGFFYVPFFCYLVLGLSFFNVYSRRVLIFLILFFLLFLLSLGNAAKFHHFLYVHIPFFRLFRNLYYFLPFILSASIFLAVEQYRILKERLSLTKNHFKIRLEIVSVFLIFLVFLLTQGDILITSFITLALSFVYFFGMMPDKRLQERAGGLLVMLILLQPLEVLAAYNRDADAHYAFPVRLAVLDKNEKASFCFVRPAQYAQSYDIVLDSNTPNYFFNWSRLSMQDFPGFISYRCAFPCFWSFYLFENFNEDVYRNYVKNKFIVFDSAQTIENDLQDHQAIQGFFSSRKRALVSGLTAQQKEKFTKEGESGRGIVLTDGGPLEILHFDVNEIKFKTHFPAEKFLVYNDSYHPYWTGTIDGVKADVYRANLAFKGLWVPAGTRIVELRFSPPGGEGLYAGVLVLLFIFYGWSVASCYPKQS